MALSRPVVLAALGVLLAVATFASMRSAADRAQADDTAAAPTVQPAAGSSTPRPAPPAPKAEPEVRAKPPKARAPKAKPPIAGLPSNVGKALEARRTVVVFFRQPAADDEATASAVRSLRGLKRVSTFSVPIAKLATYRRIVSGLGITQAPAVVIVGKSRKATLVEGFVDPASLRQQVRDTK